VSESKLFFSLVIFIAEQKQTFPYSDRTVLF